MGLGARIRRSLLLRFVRGLVKDVQRGEYGEDAMKVLNWCKANKTKIGTAVAFLAGGLKAIGQDEAATMLGLLAAGLLGAGAVPSDKEMRFKSQ